MLHFKITAPYSLFGCLPLKWLPLCRILVSLILQEPYPDMQRILLLGTSMYRYNQCCGSGMFISDPGSEFFPCRIPDPNFFNPGSASKNIRIITQKTVSKLSEIWFGWFTPEQDPDFLPKPDPKYQPSICGFRSAWIQEQGNWPKLTNEPVITSFSKWLMYLRRYVLWHITKRTYLQ